ncbi:16S rRNA (guanine(966)-N(2))-methyltransferase RsmD [Phreatobacter sp.]|uniref:16S rRNA (guanine(966)-N(2))-methyltransferase RsmD n=1 Tax=Phreatobacter sp. TaxID=1966341 RepID=UPI003F6EFFAC
MRIVGGRFRGRTLTGPRSDGIRPTSDRLRESLFNVLAHGHDDACAGARVLDLFAGTGALALEAMSRGAVFAALVDQGAEARGLIRANVDALGVAGMTAVLKRDATRLGPVAPFDPFTLVFCDPPYRKGLGEQALAGALAGGWLAPGALVVLEEASDASVALPAGLEALEERAAGDSRLVIARFG